MGAGRVSINQPGLADLVSPLDGTAMSFSCLTRLGVVPFLGAPEWWRNRAVEER